MFKKTAIFTFVFSTVLFILVGNISASPKEEKGLSIEELSEETGIDINYLKENFNSDETFEILSTTSGFASPSPLKSDSTMSLMNSPHYHFTLTVTRRALLSSKHDAIAQSRSLNGPIDKIEARSRIYVLGGLRDSDTDIQRNSSFASAKATAGCAFGVIGAETGYVYGNHSFELRGYPNVSKERTDSFKCAHF